MLPVQPVSLCHGSSQAIDSFKAQRLLYYIAGFNNQKFYSLTIECVSVFYVDLFTNCDYFPIQAKPSQAKPSQAKVLNGGGDLRESQVDVPLSVSHFCV